MTGLKMLPLESISMGFFIDYYENFEEHLEGT